MGLLRAIGRAAPVIVAGAAAGWYLRRQGLLGGPPQEVLPWPPDPEPAPAPEPEPEPEDEPLAAHAEAVEAVSDASDVTQVVEDLLAVAPGEEPIVDAEVVDEEGESEGLAEAVRVALAEQPGLLAGSVEVEVSGSTVWLRGQLERSETITEAERRAGAVAGVRDVQNLLHLPGTPPPTAGERR